MRHSHRWTLVILIVVGLQAAACTQASAPKAGKSEPAHLEQIEGSDVKRLVLTEKAAQRIDLQTAPVRDAQIVRKRTVGGEVVAPVGSGVADLGGVLVRVHLTLSDANKVDRGQPASVLLVAPSDRAPGRPLAASSAQDQGRSDSRPVRLTARAVEGPADGDSNGTTRALHYLVDSAERGLAPGQRVMVELTLSGGGTPRKVIPYAAVIYDVQGQTWAYTSPSPLNFVRQSVSIDYIDGDLAVLSEGPSAGTEVVTVGVAELFGTEFKVGK